MSTPKYGMLRDALDCGHEAFKEQYLGAGRRISREI